MKKLVNYNYLEDMKKYIEDPAPARMPWHDKSWVEARRSFDTQRRYLNGVVDVLFTQKTISARTASLIDTAIRELETCMNELEIALRKEHQDENNK